MRLRNTIGALAIAMALTPTQPATAFTHVVQKGDTLASIAEKYYGRIQYEKLLVAANTLDAHGGTPIVPGMRLEVPALEHRRVKGGETWADLAEELLGEKHRADVLAIANGTSPWLAPDDGLEILVPYNLKVVATPADTIVNIAYRFMGDMNKAWVLDHYNARRGRKVVPRNVVLVPITDLPLTADGKLAAKLSASARRTAGTSETRDVQRKVEAELPALIADVRGGRYVDAVTRGTRFLAWGSLTTKQLGRAHRMLLEAYVALGARGRATEACSAWQKNDEAAVLDPVMLSPKIIAACERATE